MRESALVPRYSSLKPKALIFKNQSWKTTGFCANIVVIPCNQWKNSAFLALFSVVSEKMASKTQV